MSEIRHEENGLGAVFRKTSGFFFYCHRLFSKTLFSCPKSGVVEVVADTGQVLVSKQFDESKVTGIRVLRALNRPQDSLMSTLSVPKLQELVIVYESGVLATVEATSLFSTLVTNRGEAARAKGWRLNLYSFH